MEAFIMKIRLKDPGSAITHGIALLLAAVGAVPLIIKAARSYDVIHIVALSIFILTMILLYAASTIYHSVDSTEKVNRRLRKMDHMMIFVMIAGSYTPVCLIVLHNRIGYPWHNLKRLLDHMPEVVIIYTVYRYGLAMCTGICSDFPCTSPCRFRLASCRRNYLYYRRCDLCTESSAF